MTDTDFEFQIIIFARNDEGNEGMKENQICRYLKPISHINI